MREQGYNVTSIGKLHFRSADDDNGFSEEIDPLHVVEGLGDLLSCVRDDPPRRDSRACITEAGPGESTYLQYDASNTAHALRWLEQHAGDDRPWVLFLSLVCPHPPFIAPPEFFARQDPLSLPLPPQWQEAEWPRHPVLDNVRRFFNLEPAFDEETLRNLLATYYAVCEYVDANVGAVVSALDELGLNDSTRVVYSTDHGESLGARGLYGKFTMYEESAAIPLILAGPDVPAGHVVQTPVSLLDMAPTILEAVDARPDDWSARLPGQSLWSLMQKPDQDRSVLSEYHTVGTRHGYFMLRDLRYKYVHYVNGPPQLFDLIDDPREVSDLAGTAGTARCSRNVKRVCGPCWTRKRSTPRRARTSARRWKHSVAKSPCAPAAPSPIRRSLARNRDSGVTIQDNRTSFIGVIGRPPRSTCATFSKH